MNDIDKLETLFSQSDLPKSIIKTLLQNRGDIEPPYLANTEKLLEIYLKRLSILIDDKKAHLTKIVEEFVRNLKNYKEESVKVFIFKGDNVMYIFASTDMTQLLGVIYSAQPNQE
ncbi:hypothetical protein R9C00_16450 [Flammeovirgaceae bacterium SG7u.111]|nr:hypothetical protein [Flammeovirgaceae bacterium SG7u.132]WPO33293.1 hypothetical protein R9C00_16450 [Flammeovirgaceae bacterium SG7u.111]